MPIHIVDENLRALKREGSFTLTPLQRVRGHSLCDKCYYGGIGSPYCPVNEGMRKQYDWAEYTVIKCKMFVPPLFFMDDVGLNTEGCNTFRLGSAWGNRVLPGDEIALIHRPTSELIRVATVKQVLVREKMSAIRNHSHKNHTFIDDGLSRGRAAKLMADLLPKLNGPLIFKHATHISVIYFE